jgi:glutathione peroxidase
MTAELYNFSVSDIDHQSRQLDEYKGKVLLIVNVASKCGLTPQYEGLEAMYRKYRDKGFEILGFPCNQFLSQEPGDEAEIKSFCSTQYDVSFPLFGKIEVNGADTAPLYQYLKEEAPGALGSKAVKWNFTKFLVGADGEVIRRYAPTDKPESIEKDIEALLASETA